MLGFVPGGEAQFVLDSFKYEESDARGLENPILLSIALGLIRGVKHIHDQGMIHRDIKPQNVLLYCADAKTTPVPKIADFGESRGEVKDLTMTYVGTPYYIAPEVFRGERYSASADVFSLAIVLNQIDTLQHPRTGVNYTAVQAASPGSFRPAIRDGVPERILSILKACTRYENNAQFGEEGDLTYGRPSIEAMLSMVQKLGEGMTAEGAST